MTNIEQALTTLKDTMETKGRVLLYGDYDVDGLCSLLIMRQFFDMLGYSSYDVVKYKARTHHVSPDVINDAINKKSSLIIIMDTGSGLQDRDELLKITKFAKAIICDHHTPQFDYASIENAIFLNPGFLDDIPYMSGACVAYEMCLAFFAFYRTAELERAKKYLSFLACASLYSDSIYNDNFYTKTLLARAKKSLIPTSVNFLPYIHASKRFYLYSFAPPFNACFRNNRLDLINTLLLNDTTLTHFDKNRCIAEIGKLRDYSREVVASIVEICPVVEYANLVFTDLTGLLNQNIPNQYIKNNKGLIANMLAARHKKAAIAVVSDGAKFLMSVRDYHNRDLFKLFLPFYNVGGHKAAFGGYIENKERLEIDDKLRFFDTKLTEKSQLVLAPFSYSTIESIAFANEYKQPKDVVHVRVPYDEVEEQWTPDSFSERYVQFKLKRMQVWCRKEAWYKQGSDLLLHFYYSTKLKADMVQEGI